MSEDKLTNKIRWLKYRWEFMRRDPNYIKLYYQKRDDRMPDPNKPFDELWDRDNDSSLEEQVETLSRTVLYEFFLGFSSPIHIVVDKELTKKVQYSPFAQYPLQILERKKAIGVNELVLSIDLEKVNSITSLKKEVSNVIDFHWERYTEKKKSSIYMIDYDLILKVGDLKEKENLTNSAIARIILPREFNENKEDANPESAIRKVSNYYKKYKELVNGGYRNFTFP